jgi:hypothetical protein
MAGMTEFRKSGLLEFKFGSIQKIKLIFKI